MLQCVCVFLYYKKQTLFPTKCLIVVNAYIFICLLLRIGVNYEVFFFLIDEKVPPSRRILEKQKKLFIRMY